MMSKKRIRDSRTGMDILIEYRGSCSVTFNQESDTMEIVNIDGLNTTLPMFIGKHYDPSVFDSENSESPASEHVPCQCPACKK
jgi:hypothetical protein